MAIDAGAQGAFIQGEIGDRLTQHNRLDLAARVLAHAKKNGPVAGAVHPRDGFKYAFQNGADFACVGMLDFQVRENIIIANSILKDLTRPRPWRA